MRPMCLRRNHLSQLPACYRRGLRGNLNTVYEEMHDLGDCAIGDKRECQRPSLDYGIVKSTGQIQRNYRDRESPAFDVSSGIGNLYLYRVVAEGDVWTNVDPDSALRHVQSRAGSVVNDDLQRAVSGRQPILG